MTSHLLLGLDATYTLDSQPTGVAVYSREILFGLAQRNPEERLKAYYRPHRWRKALAQSLPPNVSRRILTDWIKPGVSVFHGLNQRLPAAIKRRSVVTFHDLFMFTSDYSTEDFRARFAWFSRDAAQRAGLIIAVSEFTASQISSLLNVERSRIRVVRHGVRPPAQVPAVGEREPIVLSVGALQARKNVVRLVEAFERMPSGWRLVLAGGKGYGSEAILERIARSTRRADIRIAGYVSAEELAKFYSNAAILAFPSLDEGFGIPVLDAMANGVPVITSNRSGTAEVAGTAARTINPESVDEIAESLRELAGNLALREDYALRGIARASEFPWERAVAETQAVYRELA